MIAGNENYNLRQLTVDQQISLLKSNGLSFLNEDLAIQILNHISFSRIKNYLRPLRIQNRDNFVPDTTFEQAYNLYKFDSALRKLVYSELGKIEISIRTQLSYIMVDITGNPFWFTDPSNFNSENFPSLIAKIQHEICRHDEELISDFQRRYNTPFPPSWLTVEISSFGTLSLLFKSLRHTIHKRNVANFYGLHSSVMESWLHTIVYIRNTCAHHARLWNRELRIRPVIPRNTLLPFLTNSAPNNRIFFVMSIILYFLQTINPTNTFVSKMNTLFEKYPEATVRDMGFPLGWECEPLWR